MKFKRRFESKIQVDLVPMIDVIFQLILFFLVSTTFALLPGIALNLPESGTADSVPTTGITITVQSGGNMWVNQNPVRAEELESVLVSYSPETERAGIPVSLEADELVTNGTIVRILDALRRTGYPAVNLRTTEPR